MKISKNINYNVSALLSFRLFAMYFMVCTDMYFEYKYMVINQAIFKQESTKYFYILAYSMYMYVLGILSLYYP